MENSLPIKSWQDFETLMKHFTVFTAYEDQDVKLSFPDFFSLVEKKSLELGIQKNDQARLVILPLELSPKLSDLITIFALLKNNHLVLPYSAKEEEILKKDLHEISLLKKKLLGEKSGLFFKTSGTSGRPKFYFFPLEKIFATAKIQAQRLNITPKDLVGINLPLFHVSGFMQVMRSFLAAATLYKKEDYLQKAHHLSLVPTQVLRLLKNGQFNKANGKQTLLIGGSKLEHSLGENLKQNGYHVLESYGATETLGFFTLDKEVLSHLNVIQNEMSEPVLFGETLPDFYIRAGSLHQSLHHHHGITLNDRIQITREKEKTKIVVLERTDVIFKVASENINPLLIEDGLRQALTFSFSLDFLYLPFPDLEYQNLPVLLILSAEEITPDQKKHIQEKLIVYFNNESAYKSLWHPKKILFKTFPQHFEQKIGRSFYIKMIENIFLQRPNTDSPIDLIALHGFLGNPAELQSLLQDSSLELKSVFLTLPKTAELDFPELRNSESYFYHLKRFLKNYLLTQQSLTLLGYSMGGRILTRALVEILDEDTENLLHTKIQLILISSSLGLNDHHEKTERLQKDQKLMEPFRDKEKFLNFWYGQELFGPKEIMEQRFLKDPEFLSRIEFHKETLEKILHLFSPGLFPTLNETLQAILRHSLNFRNPVQLIVGEKDRHYLAHYQKLSKEAPKSFQLHVVKGAYHDPHRTNPLEITKLLQQILK